MKCQLILPPSKIILILIIGSLLCNIKTKEESREYLTVKLKTDSENNIKTENKDIGLYNSSPLIVKNLPKSSNISHKSEIYHRVNTCGCASLVKCTPCGVMIFKENLQECPCAPKPKCDKCPPISVIHDLAAKKALEDQKLVYNMKGINSNINKFLDNINKYSGDVVKYELKAKESAQKMEEAGIQAVRARKNMLKVSL